MSKYYNFIYEHIHLLIENEDELFAAKNAIIESERARTIINGESEEYPCLIRICDFWDNPNGPYEYSLNFTYLKDVLPLIEASNRSK